ncbi:MAG: hypothetical protein ACRBB6_14610 [Neptuniibacter sp.]
MSIQLKAFVLSLLFTPALVMAGYSDSERMLYGKLGYSMLEGTSASSSRVVAREIYDPHNLLIHSIYSDHKVDQMGIVNREIKSKPTSAGKMAKREIFDAHSMFIRGNW